MAQTFEALRPEYAELWRRMEVRPERAASVDRIARRLIEFKPRFQSVAAATGVPWFIIAVLHERESGANFKTHLHNGDPLTARTRLVPAGRPPVGNPPFTWEESAIDALTMPGHALNKVGDWTIERTCFEIEKFNGFGYRNHHPGVKSPYLWSFSTNYSVGKYVADGRFDAGAVDQQCGTMPLLKRMMELDASVRLPGAGLPMQAAEIGSLGVGSRGDRVRDLQSALAQRRYAVGEIDGIYGTMTQDAVLQFQRDANLPATGVADERTFRALALPAKKPVAPPELQPEDILRVLFGALLGRARAQPGATPAGPSDGMSSDVLRLILGALLGRPSPRPTPGAEATPAPAPPVVLSDIDKMLGGEALAGKKTMLAVVAYAVLAILQTVGVIGTATPTGAIVTTIIAAFGGLGGLAKIDRVIQTLGLIAAKRSG